MLCMFLLNISVDREKPKNVGEMVQRQELPYSGIDMLDISRKVLSNTKVHIAPVNNHSFTYVYNPTGLCHSARVFLLILIHSPAKNYHLRNILRKTWIKDVSSKFPDIKLAFLLGYSAKERNTTENENYEHHDIIQQNFVDSYQNNTIRTVMGFNWSTKYCSNAKYIIFQNDTMFINYDSIHRFLRHSDHSLEPSLYSGVLAKFKYSVSDIPSMQLTTRFYPPYLNGSAIIVSQSVARKFQSVFPYVKHLEHEADDLYLGVVANKLHITPHENEFIASDYLNNFHDIATLISDTNGFDNDEFFFKMSIAYIKRKTEESHKRIFLP